jgi:hypothetical protein
MSFEPPNKEPNAAHTSDWECMNCGATLTGVNNKQVQRTIHPLCVCTHELRCIRNEPNVLVTDQQNNLGGGQSFPSPVSQEADTGVGAESNSPSKELDNVQEAV